MRNCYLITGATSGLGKKIAIELANQNYSVVISGRNKRKLEKISKMKKSLIADKIVERVISDLN